MRWKDVSEKSGLQVNTTKVVKLHVQFVTVVQLSNKNS